MSHRFLIELRLLGHDCESNTSLFKSRVLSLLSILIVFVTSDSKNSFYNSKMNLINSNFLSNLNCLNCLVYVVFVTNGFIFNCYLDI